MFLVMSLRLSDHKAIHSIASSSFFRFRPDFLAFFLSISYFKFLESKEFTKTNRSQWSPIRSLVVSKTKARISLVVNSPYFGLHWLFQVQTVRFDLSDYKHL